MYPAALPFCARLSRVVIGKRRDRERDVIPERQALDKGKGERSAEEPGRPMALCALTRALRSLSLASAAITARVPTLLSAAQVIRFTWELGSVPSAWVVQGSRKARRDHVTLLSDNAGLPSVILQAFTKLVAEVTLRCQL